MPLRWGASVSTAMPPACQHAHSPLRPVNLSQHCNERSLDFFLHWCTLSVAGEFSLGRHSVKKILITLLLAATPLVALASQEVQATPDTGSKAANSHHARHHHKRGRSSHHVKHHRAAKQHSQTQ